MLKLSINGCLERGKVLFLLDGFVSCVVSFAGTFSEDGKVPETFYCNVILQLPKHVLLLTR